MVISSSTPMLVEASPTLSSRCCCRGRQWRSVCAVVRVAPPRREPRDDVFSGMHELMRVMFAMGSVGFEVPSPVPT